MITTSMKKNLSLVAHCWFLLLGGSATAMQAKTQSLCPAIPERQGAEFLSASPNQKMAEKIQAYLCRHGQVTAPADKQRLSSQLFFTMLAYHEVARSLVIDAGASSGKLDLEAVTCSTLKALLIFGNKAALHWKKGPARLAQAKQAIREVVTPLREAAIRSLKSQSYEGLSEDEQPSAHYEHAEEVVFGLFLQHFDEIATASFAALEEVYESNTEAGARSVFSSQASWILFKNKSFPRRLSLSEPWFQAIEQMLQP